MIQIFEPVRSYDFFLKTNSLVISEHRFPLDEIDVPKIFDKIRGGRNIYEVIPGLRNKFLGGKDVKLKYGCFLETKSVMVELERYCGESKQIDGLLLPHYQVLSRERIDEKIMGLGLHNLDHELFVKALDSFPEAKQFHRMRSFEFVPVGVEDIVLREEQLIEGRK